MKRLTVKARATRMVTAVTRRFDRSAVSTGNPVGMLDVEHITRVPASIRSLLPR